MAAAARAGAIPRTHPRVLLRDIPPGLEGLVDLATDLRWTWSHAADAFWKSIDAGAWEQTKNPHVVLQTVSNERLQTLADDPGFREKLRTLEQHRREYLQRPCWGEDFCTELGVVAYLSLEFGLSEALPLYAGGLGVLAGDFLKTASDLGVPVVGIGLLYQEGYFRQMVDAAGYQQEIYNYNDITSLPIQPLRDDSGTWVNVSLAFPGRQVRFRIWQVQVGRVTLYLLDSNHPLNAPRDRGITGKLYGGGEEMRLVQEIALGIGGWEIVESLGLDVDVCHLNEGHAAFATIARARSFMREADTDFWEALWATRAGNVFTTHTPIAAAFDTFPIELLSEYGQTYANDLGIDPQSLIALGRKHADDGDEPFNMAYLAARTCGHTNGVSEVHADVSRGIFQDIYPAWPREEVPISHITNGVHVPSWDSAWADKLWTEACGKPRWLGSLERLESAIGKLSDEELWTFRGQQRRDLIDYARERLARQFEQRGLHSEQVAAAAHIFDPNVLTLGFARRFTAYKRPNLLLHDATRLTRILTRLDRPVQIIVAGKAHPDDEEGKAFIHDWVTFVRQPHVRGRAAFLEDYDMALTQEMVQGVDLWINTPRRPWEACGTSGMKVLVNGGLNLSELDGWWAEAYDPGVGWALGDGREHAEVEWDEIEAAQLYDLLERRIVPEFYDRDSVGVPRAWVARMRASMAGLAPRFSSNRMMREYVEHAYLPASRDLRCRREDRGRVAKALHAWECDLRAGWQGIHFGDLRVDRDGDHWSFDVQVYLGDLGSDGVRVELYAEAGGSATQKARIEVMKQGSAMPGALNGYVYRAKVSAERPAGDFTPRIRPYHPEARIPAELPLVLWQK